MITNLPRLDDLADGFLEGLGDIPFRIVSAHFPQIGVIADVIAGAVLVDVGMHLRLTREFFHDLEGFENGGAVRLAAAEIVDFASARRFDEGGHEARDVEGMDVVAYLFSFVAEDAVFLPLEIAFHEVGEEAMELNAGVVGARKATAAQRASGQVEITAILLHHHIGGHFRGAEEGMLGLIDGEGFRNAVSIRRISVIPASGELGQLDRIRRIAVNLVGAHVHEG